MILIFFVVEHLTFMIQYMLDCFIPSTPQWVEDRINQQPRLE